MALSAFFPLWMVSVPYAKGDKTGRIEASFPSAFREFDQLLSWLPLRYFRGASLSQEPSGAEKTIRLQAKSLNEKVMS